MNTGMLRVLIDGAYDRAFSRVFLDEFSDFGYAGPETVRLPQDTPHVFLVDTLNSKEPFDLILLKKGCRGRGVLRPGGLMLFDADEPNAVALLRRHPAPAVSCGFSEKDTLTISSCCDGNLTLFVQRQIPFGRGVLDVGEARISSAEMPLIFPRACGWLIRRLAELG